MNEFELRRQLADLPKERAPVRDLWPGIEARIAAAPKRRHLPWLPLAAAASLFGASVLFWSQQEQSVVSQPTLAAVRPAVVDDAIERQADAMRIEYRVALAQLAGAPLSDDLAAAREQLQRDQQQLREALRLQPGATYLWAQLRRTYEQQLKLSQRAAFG